MRQFFSGRRLFASLSISAALALAVASCSKNVGLVVAIDSNVSVPDNIDEVGVVLADESGNVFFSNTYTARGNAKITLPAQLGVAPADSIVHVSIVGFHRSAPKVFREAIGRSPDDALAALQMGLDWEDWGSAELVSQSPTAVASSTAIGYLDTNGNRGRTTVRINGKEVRNVCDAGLTSVGGRCVDAHFNAAKLPKYNESEIFGGEGKKCFPRVACFADAAKRTQLKQTPVLKDGRCMITVDDLPAKGSFNIGVLVKPVGDFEANRKFIVIDEATEGTLGGWTREGNTINAPAALCEGAKVAGKLVAPEAIFVSTQCETKKRKNPLCENTLSVPHAMGGSGDPPEQPLSDAGADAESSDASGDAGADALVDAGPPPEADFTELKFGDGGSIALGADGGALLAADMLGAPAGATGATDSLAMAVTTAQSATSSTQQGFSYVYNGSRNDGTVAGTLSSIKSYVNVGSSSAVAYAPVPIRLTAGNTRIVTLWPYLAPGADITSMEVTPPWAPRTTTGYRFRSATMQQGDQLMTFDLTNDGTSTQKISVVSSTATLDASRAAPMGAPDNLVGGVVSTPNFTHVLLVGAAGYSLPQETSQSASEVQKAAVFFSSQKQVGADVALRQVGGAEAAFIFAYSATTPDTAHLYRAATSGADIRKAPELIADDIRVDTPTGGKPSVHPYAISRDSMLYYLRSTTAGAFEMVKKDLSPTPRDPVVYLVPSRRAGLSKVYSVAVTRAVLSNGTLVDRVYVAGARASGGLVLFSFDVAL